jgi:hypothetical protein
MPKGFARRSPIFWSRCVPDVSGRAELSASMQLSLSTGSVRSSPLPPRSGGEGSGVGGGSAYSIPEAGTASAAAPPAPDPSPPRAVRAGGGEKSAPTASIAMRCVDVLAAMMGHAPALALRPSLFELRRTSRARRWLTHPTRHRLVDAADWNTL